MEETNGAFRLRLGELSVVAFGPASGENGTRLRVDGAAGPSATIELGATDGGTPARLSIGGGRRAGKLAVEADATVETEHGAFAGVVRLRASESSPVLAIEWIGPGTTRLDATFATEDGFVVAGGGGFLEGGDRDVPFALIMGAVGTLAVGAGHAAWGARPGWLGFRPTGALEIAIAKDGAAEAYVLSRRGIAIAHRRGKTEPPVPSALIVATTADGHVAGAARTRGDGTFDAIVPPDPVRWTAFAGADRIGASTELGTSDAVVPTLPLGRLVVHVTDRDRGVPLPSRVIVRGIAGTREPNFGSPSRASGAGPLADLHDGRFASLLPAGRYRVLATRGIEYTVAREEIEITPGAETDVDLALRHVVDTPGLAGCDLHVHSRGSFDSTVAIEDRVRSLAAEGVDLAVASEHNRIGSYASASLGAQGEWLTWVRGVEVTTANPMRGHFNVFPFEGEKAPKHQKTTLSDLISSVKKDAPGAIVQVNHPRLGGGMGHFDQIHLDTRTMQGLSGLARGFDTLEVYNGFDLPKRERTEDVLFDWMRLLEAGRTIWATGSSDSHTVEYVTAGYPRTYAAVAHDHDGGEGPPVDVRGVIESLRTGRAFATSGPILEVTSGEHATGETIDVGDDGRVALHVRIRAAPWIDVDEIEVYAAAHSILKRKIPRRSVDAFEDFGALDEARRAASVFEGDLEVVVPRDARAVVVVARGSRSLGDVLPLMDFLPMAIANPFLLQHR